uniref:Uncharacterized protein n=1 Tax=Cebus imitator TaxID=2715852 RepID=A0A2K5Q023_CEBIM
MTVFFKALQNHWKKTIPGLCLLTWGGHWIYGKYFDNLLRRAAGQEAQVFDNQHIPPNAQVKKATVFLNPAACKGKLWLLVSFYFSSVLSPEMYVRFFSLFSHGYNAVKC